MGKGMWRTQAFLRCILMITFLFALFSTVKINGAHGQTSQPDGTATVLIFDTSSSMSNPDPNGTTKLKAAQAAGVSILNVIEAENQLQNISTHEVGIVDFNTHSQVDLPLTTDFDQARSALTKFSPVLRTNMPDGLKDGLQVLHNVPAGKKSIIILLSDGVPNVGLNGEMSVSEDTVRGQVMDLANQAGTKGVCIYTVGFGRGGSSGDFDEDLLQEVARRSGCGKYYNATDATQLANIYVELRHVSTGDILLHKNGQISQGENVDLGAVNVSTDQELLLFTVNWPGSKIEVNITDPSGKTVNSSYPGANISVSKSLASIMVKSPAPGAWKVVLLGADVPEKIMEYSAILSTRKGVPQSSTIVPTLPASDDLALPVLIVVLAGSGVFGFVYIQTLKTRRVQPGAISRGTLLGTGGPLAGQTIVLRPETLLGRGQQCNLFLNDPVVSRQHTRICQVKEQWYIQDQGSAGGTFLNGQKIQAAQLHSGDQIRIGRSTFLFRV